MNPPQGHPSMPHLQHMSFSQPGDSCMYHSMQHQPRPIHPKYRQYAMQGHSYEPQCNNTSVTMATTKSTAAMTTVTSSTAVINTTASSGVTSSTTSSATSTGNANAHTTTTTGLSYCVHFTQSRVATQSVSQPTNEKCKAKSTVVEDNVDLSSPINNLSVAKDKMAPQPVPINVNPPTLQTTTNSNVAQASSNNQSTLPATLSPNAADSAVAAPFKWKKGRMLGSGAFGRVFLCTDEDSNRTLAVKEVDIDPNFTNDTIKAVESLEKEIRILKRVKHDHIVQYYGTERSSNCVRIFMEYMEGGSLYHYIDKRGALEEHVASYYTRQLLEGVDYLHIREIIHRDIKGANILMDHKGYIKIADFGASKLLRSLYLSVRRPEVKNTNHKSVAGTAYWMAPEVIRGETVDHGADIWSIGCTVVEMLTCHPPYTHLETWAAMYKIATEPMCYNIPEESSNYVHDFLSQCFISEISERPAASALLKHQFVHISMCNDDVTTDGVVVAASSMASADQRRVIGNRDIDSVISQAPQSETGMDTLTPAMPTVTTITGRNNSSIANNDVQSSSTGKEAILTCIPSQVGLVSDAEGTSSSAVVTGIAASSDQSSSPAGNDDDDTPDDDDVALNDNNFDGDDISKAKAEQKITSDEVHTSATVKPNSNGISSTTVTTTVTTSTTDSATAATNSDGKDGPRYSQVKQVPKKSSNDTANYTPSAGYASNIDDNSTPLKSLSEKTIEPSNGCMQDSEPWKIRQQELQNASNAFVSNIFGNFPPSQNAAAATGGCTIQAVQIVVQGNIVMAPTAPPSSLPIFDHSKITHNSLESFAQDIYSLVDIEIILPWMLKHGLITRADQEYLISQYHTSSMRQQKFMCLVISLNENYVEKFLDCLSQTAVEYVPHDELLKKIRNEKE